VTFSNICAIDFLSTSERKKAIMLKEFLITSGVLFASYCLLRWAYSAQNGPSLFLRILKETGKLDGSAINALPLAARVHHVREDMKNVTQPERAQSFKRELRVAERRAKLANHHFFSQEPRQTEQSEVDGSQILLFM
jgi:hypothetical protein